ncbi:MAG: hypothetical protein WA921_12750 [Ahrensia sp.]
MSLRFLLAAATALLSMTLTNAQAETEATLQAGAEGTYSASVRTITLLLDMTPEVDGVRSAKYQVLENGAPVYRGSEDELFSLSYGPHFRIMEMDNTNQTPEIFISTYSGGAHCCNEITVLTKTDQGWKAVDAGAYNGDPESLYPRDVDGDGISEIVTYDNRFLYEFASYAGSYAPRQILALRGADIVDVSTEEAYRWSIQAALDQMGEMPDAGEERNSWLVTYAATLLQLGQDDPLDFALGSYDKTVDWGMIRCAMPKRDGLCPDGQEINIGFEAALTEFLTETGYLKAE